MGNLDLLPKNLNLIEIIFYPWFELQYELQSLFIENKHPVRSAFRICGIIIGGVVGVILSFKYPEAYKFFLGFAEAFKIPVAYQFLATIALSLLAFSGVGAYVSKAITRSVCMHLFGDPDFYLTKQRGAQLELIFREQGHDINEVEIRQVIDFCIENLRGQPSKDIGARPSDWARILEDLIYHADLDCFLDQQETFEIKRQRIRKKHQAVAVYAATRSGSITEGSGAGLANNRALPRNDRSDDDETTQQVSFAQLITPQFASKSTGASCVEQEDTPLLSNQRNEPRSNQRSLSIGGFAEEHERVLATKAIGKFKHHHLKHKKYTVPPSEQHILESCVRDLQSKELTTSKRIFPVKSNSTVMSSYGITSWEARQINNSSNSSSSFYVEQPNTVPDIELQAPTPCPSCP